MKRVSVILILILAFGGLADAAYVVQHEADGVPLLCNINNLSGCNTVATSPYSHLFGVPLAEYGVLFYGIVFVLAALELIIFDRLLRRVIQGASLLGFSASLIFLLIQVFVIRALCEYCVASALIAFFIFILASFIEPMQKGNTRQKPPIAPPSPPIAPTLSMPPRV